MLLTLKFSADVGRNGFVRLLRCSVSSRRRRIYLKRNLPRHYSKSRVSLWPSKKGTCQVFFERTRNLVTSDKTGEMLQNLQYVYLKKRISKAAFGENIRSLTSADYIPGAFLHFRKVEMSLSLLSNVNRP